MNIRARAHFAALTAALAGCAAYVPAPVTLTGAPDDLAALVGEWDGSYVYDGVGQRSGSILFRLAAVGDTARGDVLMTQPGVAPITLPSKGDPWPVDGPADPLLSISFVSTARGSVTGALEPYTDPYCDCTVHTTFDGRIAGDVIEGTFVARRSDNAQPQRGRWKVDRRR